MPKDTELTIDTELTFPETIPADRIDWSGSSMPREWEAKLKWVNIASSVVGVLLGMGLWHIMEAL
jgi:hypothetical protein